MNARTPGEWATVIFGVGLILLGLAIGAGGVWLIVLGGSWYYALAGFGLLMSGLLLTRLSQDGAWLYLIVYLGTWVWTIWEVGLDGWAMVPRLVAPTVLALIMLAILPVLRRRGAVRPRSVLGPLPAAIAVAAMAVLAGVASLLTPHGTSLPQSTEQAAQTPTVEMRAAAETTGVGINRAVGGLDRNGADTWVAYGANNHATRFSPADQITPENVANLDVAWHFHTGDWPERSGPALPPEAGAVRYAFQNTSLKVNDTLYVCTPSQQVIALDPATGQQKWRFNPNVDRRAMRNVTTSTCRGVAYYDTNSTGAECQKRIIFGTLDSRLLAIDADSGAPCRSFGKNGAVDLNEGIGRTLPGYVSVTSPPTIVRGVAVVGHQVIDGQYRDAPSGVVRGFDAASGEFRWAWDVGRPGVTTQPGPSETYTRGTPNVWTIMSADEELGLVYLPTGNPAVDYYGGDRRPFDEQYNSSMVAVDAVTGRERWKFQTVHHDIWDYDLGAQATLVDFATDAGPVPALIVPTKQGQLYVLDRRTGQPLTPVEERQVPQGATPGDWTSPTQPFSVGMPSLVGDRFVESDMWGTTPIDQLWCRIEFNRIRYRGPYTPPALGVPTAYHPGFNGGVDWGGVAVDPERGFLVVNNNNLPNTVQLLTREEVQRRGVRPVSESGPRTTGGLYPQEGAPFGAFSAPWRTIARVPCTRPPWGFIGVIDLKTRRFVWREPLGTGRDHGPFGIPSMLPITMGTPNNGGAAVTRSGLIFISAALDRVIRAFDTRSGKLLWQARLPAGGQATPLTYMSNGRQYVVIAAGGHNSMETTIGDSVIAYALPAR